MPFGNTRLAWWEMPSSTLSRSGGKKLALSGIDPDR